MLPGRICTAHDRHTEYHWWRDNKALKVRWEIGGGGVGDGVKVMKIVRVLSLESKLSGNIIVSASPCSARVITSVALDYL